ncbi:MAG: hydroxyurea phosphotransferase [Streptomyces sp.]|nr:hydroxyurea phosphotransferase [Streptomyces sp.]
MVDIPAELVETQTRYNGAAGRAFIAALPALAARFHADWALRPDGPPRYGVCALVLPVRGADGTPAVLKLQLPDGETEGEPLALRAWDGDGAVRLLAHDETTGTLLLERLDATRTLADVPVHQATLVIGGLLAHLTARPAPPGLRRLADLAPALLDRTPPALARVPDPAARALLTDCAAALREVATEPGDRLLHWDLHHDNVLAADRAPWLAIDPKPLSGDPGFDLFPALRDRYDPADVRWRFDALTDALALDRPRARAWTLARVLQTCVWETEEGGPLTPEHLEIARLLRR